MPAFVDLSPTMQHKPYNSPGAAMLGRGAAAVKVDGDEVAVMKNLAVPADHLASRQALLNDLDTYRKAADRSTGVSVDTFHDRAFDVLTSSRMVEALDVTREPERTRERYGRGSPKHQGDGAPQWNDQLLMARRVVEAGARVVTVGYGFWDTHGQNFRALKNQLPLFDKGISALVEDIYARGLDKDVTVCVWGEFGRTPKINKDAGRDHWARVNFALLSGGGMRTGQVIGSTDSAAAEAKDDPIPYPNVLATVYKNLDRQGVLRPKHGLVQKRVPVHKPDAQAKDTALCKTTSRDKRLPEWFESLDSSLARQACRLEVVTLRLTRSNRAQNTRPDGRRGVLGDDRATSPPTKTEHGPPCSADSEPLGKPITSALTAMQRLISPAQPPF
jgi:hypothetical protein